MNLITLKLTLVFIFSYGWVYLKKILFKKICIPKKLNKISNIKNNNIEFNKFILEVLRVIDDILTLPVYIYIYINYSKNEIESKKSMLDFFFIITLSYFIFDLYYTIKYNTKEYLLHHIVTIIPIFLIIFENNYHYIYCKIAVFGKISGSFMYLFKILEPYNFNKIIWNSLMIIFFIFFFYGRIMFFFIWNEAYLTTPIYFSINYYFLCFVNLIWFYQIISKLSKEIGIMKMYNFLKIFRKFPLNLLMYIIFSLINIFPFLIN